jgi:hypothetical protein
MAQETKPRPSASERFAGICREAATGFAEGNGFDIWAKANQRWLLVPLVAETQNDPRHPESEKNEIRQTHHPWRSSVTFEL